MHEFSVSVAYVVKPTDNITNDVAANVQRRPDSVGLRRQLYDTWVPVTWREFAGQVRDLAAGFIAAGVQPGDRVALMSRTRYEWTVLDYAILTAGGVVVPVYPTSSPDQVEWILSDSGAVAIVVETGEHADKIAAARARLPALRHVWVIDGDGLAGITARGALETPEHVEERRRSRGAGDLAEIVYTSGTTGRPKGCMLSHGNIVANTRNCMLNDGFPEVFNQRQSTLLFLPLSHSYAQLIQYGAVHTGTVLGLTDMADAVAQLPAFAAHCGAVGAACVAEGVPEREAHGHRRGARHDLRGRGGRGRRVQPGARRRRSRRRSPAQARAVRPARLPQVAGSARR